MDDILHILDLLRERAQADLVLLTTQRSQFLQQITNIKHAAKNSSAGLSNITDQQVWENWQYGQIVRIKTIEKQLAGLETEIAKAKMHFKTILAKHLSAQKIAKDAAVNARMRAEETDAEMQLDIHRQNKLRLN